MQIRLVKPESQLCHSELSGQCNKGHTKSHITGFSAKSILKKQIINISSVITTTYHPSAAVPSLNVLHQYVSKCVRFSTRAEVVFDYFAVWYIYGSYPIQTLLLLLIFVPSSFYNPPPETLRLWHILYQSTRV